MPDRIGVLIVERQRLYQLGFAASLETAPDLRVVGEAGTAAEGYRLTEQLLPAVALVGAVLPDAPGLAAIREFGVRWPSLAVVVVSDVEREEERLIALQAGAAAYVGKGVSTARLTELVRRSAAGEQLIGEQLRERHATECLNLSEPRFEFGRDATSRRPFASLTAREREILQGIGEGLANARSPRDSTSASKRSRTTWRRSCANSM